MNVSAGPRCSDVFSNLNCQYGPHEVDLFALKQKKKRKNTKTGSRTPKSWNSTRFPKFGPSSETRNNPILESGIPGDPEVLHRTTKNHYINCDFEVRNMVPGSEYTLYHSNADNSIKNRDSRTKRRKVAALRKNALELDGQ
ncbi:hypothetical protein AYI69_g2078 [Smittium culicis]|uniref:Uncharacterized protein n=1 Tax=Smittium culicis TaxID=133412 RepID=A0A1R1YNN0_9FUNG|nr:hypothetical protein AYI69_g2078 [Smittium culicis]